MKQDGGSAFPHEKLTAHEDGNMRKSFDTGMSLRDYFAAKVITSLIADSSALEAIKQAAKASGKDGMRVTADVAYAYADAMLKARDEP